MKRFVAALFIVRIWQKSTYPKRVGFGTLSTINDNAAALNHLKAFEARFCASSQAVTMACSNCNAERQILKILGKKPTRSTWVGFLFFASPFPTLVTKPVKAPARAKIDRASVNRRSIARLECELDTVFSEMFSGKEADSLKVGRLLTSCLFIFAFIPTSWTQLQ